MTLQNLITFDLLSYYDGKLKNWIKNLKASSSQDGLMSKEDFDKLDAIAEGAQVNVIEQVKVNGSALTVTDKAVNIDIAGKADKVTTPTDGNFAGLNADGNLTDSGKKASDFATAAQGGYADSALQTIAVGTDGSYVTTTVGTKSGNDGAKTQTVAVAVTTADPSTATQQDNGLATAYDVKQYVNTKISAGINYRGTVQNYTALQAITNPAAGDMYNVEQDETISGTLYPGDMNYIYVAADGTNPAFWDQAAPTIKLETATNSQIDGLFTA